MKAFIELGEVHVAIVDIGQQRMMLSFDQPEFIPGRMVLRQMHEACRRAQLEHFAHLGQLACHAGGVEHRSHGGQLVGYRHADEVGVEHQVTLHLGGEGRRAHGVEKHKAGEAAAVSSGVPSVRQRLVIGTMTNLTNPKGIVFMVAVLPQFIDPHRPLWLQLLILLVTSIGVDLVVMHGYAFLASRAQRWLATARARRVQNRVFGGVLMAMGASLLMVKRVA